METRKSNTGNTVGISSAVAHFPESDGCGDVGKRLILGEETIKQMEEYGSLITFIGGVLSIFTLIVFFYMAYNISQIKKLLEEQITKDNFERTKNKPEVKNTKQAEGLAGITDLNDPKQMEEMLKRLGKK